MTSNWPHWPEDQLSLFELPEPTKRDKTEAPRNIREITPQTILCRSCGALKTRGLPCGCEEATDDEEFDVVVWKEAYDASGR